MKFLYIYLLTFICIFIYLFLAAIFKNQTVDALLFSTLIFISAKIINRLFEIKDK